MKKPLKVLYTNYHDGYGGGHTTYLMALANSPLTINYVATPTSSDLYQFLQASGFNKLLPVGFARKPKHLGLLFKSAKKIARFIEEHEIDIVHANGDADNRTVYLAKYFCKRPFKHVFTKHNSHPITNFIAKRKFKKLDGVIFVARSIKRTLGIKPLTLNHTVIENGVNTTHWQLKDEPKLPADATYLDTDKIRLTSIAGTMHYKGWHNLVNALKTLPAEIRSKFVVTLVGKTIPELRKLNWCNGDYLSEQVHFIGFKTDPRAYLAHSDIGFVLSHEVETISFACREMMSMGLPMIVSDYAGLPDNVDNDINGWITQTNDVESIAKVLKNIATMTPKTLSQMKQAARKKAEQEFAIAPMLEKTQALYLSCQ
ncbi:glycosyltransferase family 4 protein [Catenovulum sp. SM1970]|uniref:glycosyltransferase family 4 protein n=1 Tax=Marinifaba aquimaris TaxID=2741323 RepID=UPI00157424A2|nr:glycosyltransferase family 4 protein [Marinifaba aquimaris]NTS77453.1 glycosyltransferase family 4 protein [Marinifaba aquimaris]